MSNESYVVIILYITCDEMYTIFVARETPSLTAAGTRPPQHGDKKAE